MPRNTAPLAAAALLAASIVPLSGCVVAVGNRTSTAPTQVRTVSSDEMTRLLAANRDAQLAMSREEALSVYPPELVSLREARVVRTSTLHVYQIRAQERRGASVFERWLYFVDNKLVEISDERIPVISDDRFDSWVHAARAY